MTGTAPFWRGPATTWAVLCALSSTAAGCRGGDGPADALSLGPPQTSRGLQACLQDGLDGQSHEGWRCTTHRGVAGISMGGGAAMRIGLEHPELFDVSVALGAPYIDLEQFLLSVSEISNGGFCTREQLLANLEYLDAKDDPRTWCGPVVFDELAIEDSECDGFAGDYNHHYRGPDAGRGGSFNREGSLEIVQDFALAYGNPAFYNPDSFYLPPGVPGDHMVDLALLARDRRGDLNEARRELCANPIRLEGVYDADYNPDGTYPVITYCDGNGRLNGEYEPGIASFPFEVTLAVDYNDNGRRDYAEPTIAQPFERYRDLGEDGRASEDEPGYDPVQNPDPTGDDYHWLDNPSGAEGNLRRDEVEAFDDFGLDGVDGTGDYGEGNGAFDQNPNLDYAFSRSPRRLIEAIDARMLDRLHLYVDAGIRDFLLSAQITNPFWGALRSRTERTRRFRDWSGLAAAAMGPGEAYDPNRADLSEAAIGRHAYLRYGDPSVCPGVDEATGRGNHVGSAQEALHRILTAIAFASARFEGGDFTALPGALADRGSPEGSLTDFVQIKSFDSPALGRSMPYVVVLPPDYFEAPEASYPVLYFLHGQGQKATDLAASALLMLGPQMSSEDPDKKRARKSDWQKMIVVFADGECPPGECYTGTFYIDHRGPDGRGPRHGEAFFELIRTVETEYRARAPLMRPYPRD